MKENLNKKEIKELFEVIARLENPAEVRKFFRDVATISEIESLTERWQVAKLLDEGISYREISKQTSASTTTVTRVAHWLNHGMGGYRLMLDRLKKK